MQRGHPIAASQNLLELLLLLELDPSYANFIASTATVHDALRNWVRTLMLQVPLRQRNVLWRRRKSRTQLQPVVSAVGRRRGCCQRRRKSKPDFKRSTQRAEQHVHDFAASIFVRIRTQLEMKTCTLELRIDMYERQLQRTCMRQAGAMTSRSDRSTEGN